VEGVIFIAILFLGLAYVWVKGDLDWVIHWDRREYDPPQPRMKPFVPPPETPEPSPDDGTGKEEDGEAA